MSYLQAGTCALCGRSSEYLCDSEWGRVHEDCGYRRASREQRDKAAAEAAARDEALREEGRTEGQLQAAEAIIRRLRDRAAQFQHRAAIVVVPKSVARLEGAAMALLDEADVLERAMVTAKEGT